MEWYTRCIVCLCLWREARGESLAAKTAILWTLRNRVNDTGGPGGRGRWPKSLVDVVLQPKQFSSFNLGEKNSVQFPTQKNPADWNAWLDCLTVYDAALGADPTGGANHYNDASIAPPFKAFLGPNATLADLQAKQTAQLGRLTFYKL